PCWGHNRRRKTMAAQQCSKCHKSFSSDLSECPHCHAPTAKAEEAQTFSEDDILEILDGDSTAQDLLADESVDSSQVVAADASDFVEIVEVQDGDLEEQPTEIVEIVEEHTAPPAASDA